MHYYWIKICVQRHFWFTKFINFLIKMSEMVFFLELISKIALVPKLKNRELEFGSFWVKAFFANFGHWRQNMPLHRKDQQKPKLLTSSLWKVVTFFGIKHVMRTNNGKVMDEKRKKWECRNVTSFCFFLSQFYLDWTSVHVLRQKLYQLFLREKPKTLSFVPVTINGWYCS